MSDERKRAAAGAALLKDMLNALMTPEQKAALRVATANAVIRDLVALAGGTVVLDPFSDVVKAAQGKVLNRHFDPNTCVLTISLADAPAEDTAEPTQTEKPLTLPAVPVVPPIKV